MGDDEIKAGVEAARDSIIKNLAALVKIPSRTEIFGWIKAVGTSRKARYRGTQKLSWYFTLVVAAYDLVRMRNLGRGAA